MAFDIRACESDDRQEACTSFALHHRSVMVPGRSVQDLLFIMKNHFYFGKAVAACDRDGEICGISGFVAGSPELRFHDRENVHIHLLYHKARSRDHAPLVDMLEFVVGLIGQDCSDAAVLHLHAPASRPELSDLYGKLAAGNAPSADGTVFTANCRDLAESLRGRLKAEGGSP